MNDTRHPLVQALRAAHVRLGLAAVIVASLVLTGVSFFTLRTYVNQNLALVARSISYTAEAATVFRDAAAATEVLTLIAQQEKLLSAEIFDARGHRLAAFTHGAANPIDAGLSQLGSVLFPLQATSPITQNGREFGQVAVRGNGGVYVAYILKVLVAVGLCAAVLAALVARLSRRIEREVVAPLRSLASLTRTARLGRAYALRAPESVVKEIHELGEDFNALMAEIQGREAELVAKHDRLKTANESLSHLAFHDGLTGLPNRASFLERATRAVGSVRGGDDKVAVLYVDSDDFKAINDNLGHAAGDELLVETARRIRAQLREEDVVARIGGDEFAVLLSSVRTLDDATRIAAKVAATIRVPLHSAVHGTIVSSASIGVALFPDHGGSVDALLSAADAAMYRAKATHQGSYEVFNPATDGESSAMLA
jgi:diguanylate cyclase (GGDEF)-like protein